MAFTHLSKYCKYVYFHSKLYKFSRSSILILLSCFKNFFCPVGINITVVDSYCSSSTNFACSPRLLLFCSRRMLLADEVLQDPLSLEPFDPPSLQSFQPIRCSCCLFLSSLVFSSPQSLSPSCRCNEVPCSVADLVVNVVLVEVLGALLLPLPLFHGVCV